MSNYNFVEIRDEHLPAVLDIYNYYVLNSTATFHMNLHTIDEMKGIVYSGNPRFQTFVIMENDIILGYVLLTQYKKREAYDSTAEVTIYLKPDCIGKGIGTLALKFIEDVAKKNEMHALLAIICGENIESIKLFEKNGYFKCAYFKEVGVKFGRLLDVVGYQKII